MKTLSNAKAHQMFLDTTFSASIYGYSGRINVTSQNELYATLEGEIIVVMGHSFRWAWYSKCPAEYAKELRRFAKRLKHGLVKFTN